jgi:serine/threonine protein kinase
MEVVRQVGLGLQALHDQGVLHRDVKPANVLFRTPDRSSGSGGRAGAQVRAMLGDLGLGKAMDMSSRLTMIAGTPTFVAPEQAQGEHLDPRADQYSLGALTFLLFTGRAPYAHASLSAAAAPGAPPTMSVPEREFPEAVEDVVRRALDPEPDRRWPDVTAYVDALQEALGENGHAPMPAPWLPVDPELTQPGSRPSEEPTPPASRRGRRVAAACAAVGALAVGAAVGYAVHGSESLATVSDDSGSLRVTVPSDWQQAVAREGWRPPNDRGRYAALSLGTEQGWASESSPREGVFLGILPGDELPTQVPQHPECRRAQSPVNDMGDVGSWVQVVYTGCPDGMQTVERVVLVAANRLLWVQVRSEDGATANSVLDSVSTSGI